MRTSFYQLSQLDQPLISSVDDNLINDLQRYERGWGVFVFVCRACEGFAVEGSQRYESRGGGIPAITKAGVKVLRILICISVFVFRLHFFFYTRRITGKISWLKWALHGSHNKSSCAPQNAVREALHLMVFY